MVYGLIRVFSGKPGINAYGVAGLVVMVAGAGIVFASSKIAPMLGLSQEKGVIIKLAGALICAAGAILVIAIGK